MTDLSKKTVLLTGALGSLGRAQAVAFAAAGARLFLLDRPAIPNGPAFAKELADKHGVEAEYVGHDLADLDATEKMGHALSDRSGGIDILINDAALIINRPFEDFSIAEYDEQLRVNAAAGLALARAVAPAMKRKRYGKIINFCSLTLNGRWDGYVPYVVSKGAVLGLTKGLARELGPFGICVNAIAPGAVVSEAEERVFGDRLQEYSDWILENQSLKKRIQPSDIANLSLFLASPASDMISGQNIGIDGGW